MTYADYLKSLGLSDEEVNILVTNPNAMVNTGTEVITAQEFHDRWLAETGQGNAPSDAETGAILNPDVTQSSAGGADTDIEANVAPDGTTATATDPNRIGLPNGFRVVIPNVLMQGPDGTYYDYAAWLEAEYLNPVDTTNAETMISTWLKEQTASGTTNQQFFGGIPEKQTDADGNDWWVYRDQNGNIIDVQQVDDTTKEMTPYEKAQYDLQQQQFSWEKERYMLDQQRAEEQKYTTPREWIQRWGVQNPGTLPNAPDYINQFAPPVRGESGTGDIGTLDASRMKLASGRAFSDLAPSELQGVYGYVDWAAGRGSPYASGEDWAYRSQQLLPTNQPKRTVSWNPNVRS